MDKLYPPSINGTIPAFYSKTINAEVLSNLRNRPTDANTYNTDYSNGYFITCQTDATNPNTPSTFNKGKLQPLDPLNPNNKVFYYCGLYIAENTPIKQLAIIYQENGEKQLELVLFNNDWDKIDKDTIYNIYFTIDNTIQINQVDKWIRSSSQDTPSSCGIYLEPIQNNETAEILIPFSMNRSIGKEDIKGFSLKIKTIQANTQICVLEQEKKDIQFLNNQIEFIMPSIHINKIHPGEFLKVQLAYLYGDSDLIENWEIGYYSTVGIIKYTGKPNINLQNLSIENNNIMFLLDEYKGEYENSLDFTEKPILHCFSLLINETLKETSGWIHQNNYSFNTDIIDENINYQIKYQVKTLNGLEEEIIYNCITPVAAQPELYINLEAINNFEDSYIELSFKPDGWVFNSELQNLNRKNMIVSDEPADQLNITNTLDDNTNIVFNTNIDNNTLDLLQEALLMRQNIEIDNDSLNIISQIVWPENEKVLYLYRIEENSEDWIKIATINLNNYNNTFEWSFKDFTIEQGKKYQYGFKEQVSDQITIIKKSEPIIADFEDTFLWDGKKQIKIRFNPKVSSFKTNKLESKIETIGSRYPFIFSNDVVEYKEFPISGLISYLADNAELFMKAEDLGILLDKYSKRRNTPTFLNDISNHSETTDLLNYNIKAERIFKLQLLEWLGNGKIKLFKSPTEGNYLVRLMNISLTPEDRLGRMLHSFSCTAYEVKENTNDNLLKLGFFNNEG